MASLVSNEGSPSQIREDARTSSHPPGQALGHGGHLLGFLAGQVTSSMAPPPGSLSPLTPFSQGSPWVMGRGLE